MRKLTVQSSVLLLFVIWLIAATVNFNVFLIGNTANMYNIIATAVYIIVVTMICFVPTDRTARRIILVLCIVSLCTAVISGVSAVNHLSVGFIIPFSFLFIAPFHGLTAIFLNDWLLLYSVITAVNVIWTLMNMRIYIKNSRDTVN